jgi:HEAT repeat protein
VRETARFLLKKKGVNDFNTFYRDSLDSKQLYGAICGLGETGMEEDAVYLLNYLDYEQINIVRSTVKALSKLIFKEFKDTFIEMLADKRPGISKEARLALYGKINATDAYEIYSYFIDCNTVHTRKNAALLLCSLSKWDSIEYIIELCADEDETISEIAKYYLGKWIDKFNRSFTVPSLEQLQRIEVSIDKYGYAISNEQVNWIKAALVSLKKD